jgi:hypothetical protein
LQTLAEGFRGDERKIERYLRIHAERLTDETPAQKRWRSSSLALRRKSLGGELT